MNGLKLYEVQEHEGYTVRRYIDTAQLTITTWEVPVAVLRSISMARVRACIARAQRGIKQRASVVTRRRAVSKLLEEGWKPAAIAHYLELSVSHVCNFRKGLGKHGKYRRSEGVEPTPLQSKVYEALRHAPAGTNCAQIGREVGASDSYVRKIKMKMLKEKTK